MNRRSILKTMFASLALLFIAPFKSKDSENLESISILKCRVEGNRRVFFIDYVSINHAVNFMKQMGNNPNLRSCHMLVNKGIAKVEWTYKS